MRRWLIVIGALGIVSPGCSSYHLWREMRTTGEIPAPKPVRNAINGIQAAQNDMDSKVSIAAPSYVNDRLRQSGGGPSLP